MNVETEPPPPPKQRGAYRHDGFFLRIGLGVGLLSSRATFTASGDRVPLSPDGDISVITGGLDFMIGGTPASGLVVGGGIISQGGSTGSYDSADGDEAFRNDLDFSSGMLFGFLDWYPDPTAGFHLGGGAGIGGTSLVEQQTRREVSNSTGGGLLAFIGYEGYSSKQWSFGVVVRGQLIATGRGNQVEERVTTLGAALLATVTYH